MILHVISGLGMGGAERNLFQVAKALQRQGLEQHVVSVSDRGVWAEEFTKQGIEVTPLGVRAKSSVLIGLYRLVRLVNRLKPHVIQGWMYHGDLFAAFAHRLALGRNRRLLFWNLRASNMNLGGYSTIIHLNAWLSRWPDLIIANSRAGFDSHLAQGYRPRRFEVISNGIDIEAFRPDPFMRAKVREEFGISSEAILAIHVARIDPMKDHASFLAAMEKLPQVRGLMIGKGTEMLKAPANVLALGLRRDLPRFYAAADIVVSTSIYGEGFSNVLAEGMSCGLVPIATDVGDARIIIGDTGAIMAPRDVEALINLIAVEVVRSIPDRQARGMQARDRIVHNFASAKAAEAFARLYAPNNTALNQT